MSDDRAGTEYAGAYVRHDPVEVVLRAPAIPEETSGGKNCTDEH